MRILGYFLAICIGLSLGLIGGGGSVLAVPILVYIMGLGAKTAIATSLVIVGTVSLIGVVPHWSQGNINLSVAAMFVPTAMLGSYLGARLTGLPWITETIQLICFALVMVSASMMMIWQVKPTHHKHGLFETNHHFQYQWLVIPLEGLGVGILTGFVGVGGGFLIIPALVLFGGIPMKEAIGTSLMIITFNSVAGFVGYLGQVNLDWNLTIFFAIAASLGTITGAYLIRFIEAKQLQKAFGYFVLAIGVFVLVQH